MSHTVRPITTDEVSAFRASLAMGFGGDAKPDDDDRFRSLMPLDRTVAVFDGDAIVGTLGDFPLSLTLPGGAQLPMAGTTMVTVRATHTRQGILRTMIKRHLDNAVGRGEAIAGLWASEPGIYGRFGFGIATECHDTAIDAARVQLPEPADNDVVVELVAADQLGEVVAPYWSAQGKRRAGFIDRNTARWDDIAADPEHRRGGKSAARHIVARRNGEVVGYAEYRQKDKWEGFVAEGAVSIGSLVASDHRAQLALWRYLLSIDLFPNVDYWDGAIDDPLPFAVSNLRNVRRVVLDGLYVRILDVAAALDARHYEHDGRIVLGVTDVMGYAAGTYELVVTNGVGVVAPTETDADVELDVRELGALYLGRRCVDLYARHELITGSTESLRQLDVLFGTARAPWCSEMF
jgi:predicted acetyltransferase